MTKETYRRKRVLGAHSFTGPVTVVAGTRAAGRSGMVLRALSDPEALGRESYLE